MDITFPIFANLRCGAWYSPSFDGSCYFKSSDGHYGCWEFNLSRINLHVIEKCAEKGGIVIIDSTRKGKPFPDSFNRTIPIWTYVINNVVVKRKLDLGMYELTLRTLMKQRSRSKTLDCSQYAPLDRPI